MSELKTILERQKLDHQEKVLMKKSDANILMTAFRAYKLQKDEYRFVPYQRKMSEDLKTLFPADATLRCAVMFVPYAKTVVERILGLADKDETVLEQDAKEQAKRDEAAEKYMSAL